MSHSVCFSIVPYSIENLQFELQLWVRKGLGSAVQSRKGMPGVCCLAELLMAPVHLHDRCTVLPIQHKGRLVYGDETGPNHFQPMHRNQNIQ